MNLRPSGYEPDELPDCSIPRHYIAAPVSQLIIICLHFSFVNAALLILLIGYAAFPILFPYSFPDFKTMASPEEAFQASASTKQNKKEQILLCNIFPYPQHYDNFFRIFYQNYWLITKNFDKTLTYRGVLLYSKVKSQSGYSYFLFLAEWHIGIPEGGSATCS